MFVVLIMKVPFGSRSLNRARLSFYSLPSDFCPPPPQPWEAGTQSCQDLWTHGERSPCWSRFLGQTCDPTEYLLWCSSKGLHPIERTFTAAAHKELQPIGRSHSGKVQGGLSPMDGTAKGFKGKKLRKKEQQRQCLIK